MSFSIRFPTQRVLAVGKPGAGPASPGPHAACFQNKAEWGSVHRTQVLFNVPLAGILFKEVTVTDFTN